MSSPSVIVLPTSITNHVALLNVLFEALKRASQRQLLNEDDVERLLCDASRSDCSVTRRAIETVLEVLEGK